jgi:hypothetical protein
MRKLLALAVISAALVIGNVARAAAVDVFVTQQALGSQLWDITIVTDGTQVGGLALLGNTTVTALTLNPLNTGIDMTGLSSLVPDVLGDGTTNAIGINNTAGGVSFASGPTPTLIGSLTILLGTGPNPGDVRGGDDLFGYTVCDTNCAPIADYSVTVTAFPAPEPGVALLLGVGLAGLSLVRRRMA